MPSFIVFALWVGTDFWAFRPWETSIIRENANESKGLLPSVVLCQTIERTDFFRQWTLPGTFGGMLLVRA
jgi:hypothetical protein